MFLRHSRLWFTALIIWFVALFILSSMSHPNPPGPDFPNKDKVMHATYYALGGLCLFIALRLKNPNRTLLHTSVTVVIFCSLVGVFDEWHQTFTPDRSGNDPFDWMADTFGGVLGSSAGIFLKRLIPFGKSPSTC